MDRLLQRIGLQHHVKAKPRCGDGGGGYDEDEEEARLSTVSTQWHAQCVSVSACDRSPVGGDSRLQWCDLLSAGFPTDVVCVPTTSPADSDDVYSCAVSNEGRRDAKVRVDQLATDDKCNDAAARVKRRPYRGLRERIRHNCHYLELHRMEFRPGAIRRRFCGGKKHDNELYRSNSFKFERFERSEDSGSIQNQVSLCEEYSIPVDFVNKPRPHSFGANLVNWTTPSPSGESVEIVAAYCDPRDSKAYLEPGEEASGKLYTSPDRDYSQPYTDNSWEPRSSDGSDDGVYEDVGLPQDSPLDAVNKCVTVIRVNESADEYEEELGQTFPDEPVKAPVRRNPSPYYYGDLFRAEIGLDRETSLGSFHFLPGGDDTDSVKHAARLLGELKVIPVSPKVKGYRKSSSVDTPSAEVTQTPRTTRVYVHDQGYRKSVSLDSPAPAPSSEQPIRVVVKQRSFTDGQPLARQADDACPGDERPESLLAACLQEWDSLMPPRRGLRGPGLSASCACASGGKCVAGNREDADDSKRPSADHVLAEDVDDEFDEMSGRRRHLYETAFDSKVSRSDDDLDEDDKVTNHPALHGAPDSRVPRTGSSQELGTGAPKERRLITLVRGKLVKERPKSNPLKLKADSSSSSTILSRGLDDLDLDGDRNTSASASPLRGFTSSPPSTAPLPTKFHGKDDLVINSIKSAPNLPLSSPGHPRLKDLRLPVKSLRAREESKQDILEFKGRPRSFVSTDGDDEAKMRPRSMFQESDLLVKDRSGIATGDRKVLEIKGRPTIDFSRSKVLGKETENILEIKGRPRKAGGVRLNFSSTESMATSSSGGSLESIRSSTSEGNRSTSSSESQHSTSLSSHSSDSLGSVGSTTINLIRHFHHQGKGTGLAGKSGSRMFSHHSNKLHILSPISDKSSIEPASETSDNNRNNNSQKASPEEGEIVPSPTKPPEPAWMETGLKVKRRTPQNKNLLSLSVLQSSSSGEAEVQGSDSGISIESRSTTKNKGYSGSGFSFLKLGSTSHVPSNVQNDLQSDFTDLPFDMPKLRRRRLQQDTCTSGSVTSVELPFDMPKLRRHVKADTACTSGSATSIDLQDLPFDMPKLRRRLRCGPQQTTPSFGSELGHPAGIPLRPSLTLNLDQGGKAPPKLLFGLSLNIAAPTIGDDAVDTSLPLDRQGWYHGTITRVEAESVLRLLREGSYLVRNSESARQDYSLSLKSAKGFMHMRIQANQETGKFILGQFSNPFDNIPDMIRHYSVNRLPIRGAEHMCLLHPVIEQLL